MSYSGLHLFVRITNQHKFGTLFCLNLVTPISQQPSLQLTNSLLHLGCIISEQHPYPLDTWFCSILHHGETSVYFTVILQLNIKFSTTSTSIRERSFAFWSHRPRAASQVTEILICSSLHTVRLLPLILWWSAAQHYFLSNQCLNRQVVFCISTASSWSGTCSFGGYHLDLYYFWWECRLSNGNFTYWR